MTMWAGNVQGGYPTQWALNPSAYQNLPNEQVDWATLAQQWIKMKETFPVDQVPPAPPPPSIKGDIEAGEAPMDMSKDDVPSAPSSGTSQDGSSWGNWNNWQQWGWNWSGGTHGGPGAGAMSTEKQAPVPPYTYSTNNTSSYSAPDTPTTFDYNHGVSSAPSNFDQQEYNWPADQAPYVRQKSSEWRGEHRASSSRRSAPKVEEVEPDTTALFDAAKRKQLPAWIREGLEKMEREKQKKIDRERQLKEREEELQRRKREEEEALASGIPLKSKFETDSEESDREATEEAPVVKPRKSRFDATSPVTVTPAVTKSSPPPQPPVKRKSREEILQEVMQQVRYVLTNILMTVTNEEMQKIAEEVHADFRTKAPATQLRKTPAFTSLTGKLGLGIYDTESEESSAESDNETGARQENGVDSDEELRERIYRKKQEFARIERDIEHQVELQEKKDREREQRAQAQEDSEEEEEEESPVVKEDMGQVEPKLAYTGIRSDVKIEETKYISESKNAEVKHTEFYTPERPYKTEIESSEEHTEDSDHSSSKSESSSRSSSSTRYKKSRKSSKRRKEKKSSKRKRKRSTSRGSERKKSSHKKSSHRYEEPGRRYERSRSRSRSRSRGHYDEYRRKRRHSSESSHHRRSNHHSYSRSPDHSRGKKSSHRSRD